jgi:putative ABC transport system permease protein
MRQAQLEREGLSAAEATLASRRALGNVTLAREDVRDIWVLRWLQTLRQDVRNGLRILIKHPGVPATATLSLALGIGANTAVFSLVDGILLKPLPYAEPDRLVMIWAVPEDRPAERSPATIPEYIAWTERVTSFDAMATAWQGTQTLGAEDDSPAELVLVEKVRASLFDVLGVRPVVGRALRADEEPVDAPARVVVLSDQFWDTKYGRDPSVINEVIRLNNVPHTIVGVMPPAFAFLWQGKADLFMPLSFNSPQLRGTARVFPVVARLKPGVTIAQAQAEMDVVLPQLEPTMPVPSKGWRARVVPLHEATRGELRPALSLLQSIVAFVLLIACGNVAGLLMARAASRRTEIAVRSAIGAGRTRLIRQLLTESAVLALAGGLAGLAVGWLLLKLLVTMSTTLLPALPEAPMDWRVLAFTLAVSVLTGLVFGILPALQGSRTDLVASLNASPRGTVGVLAGQRMRSVLVVAQLALAFILLIGAGLALRGFVTVERRDLGGQPDGVFRVDVPFRGMFRQAGSYKGYPLVNVDPRVNQTIDGILERLRAVPGVESVAGASLPPFTFPGPPIGLEIQGRPPAGGDPLAASFQVVTRGFFATMRIPMEQGREFDERDTAAGPWGIVINRTMARRLWPDGNPIGQRLVLDMTADEQPREVIGVVRDYRASPHEELSQPAAMFVLYSQQPLHTRGPLGAVMRNRMNFVVRTAGDPGSVAGAIRSTMAGLDREQPVPEVSAVSADLAEVVAPWRYTAVVFVLFAGVATLLAAVGLYGVMSYGVGLRTREIGIRMALGADRGEVMGLIMRRVMLLAALGLGGGLAGALALSRVMSSLLSGVLAGVPPTDVVTYLGVTLLMAIVALLAGWIPTRRALRVAPTVALRCE